MKHLIKKILLWGCAKLFRDEGPKVIYYHDIGTENTDMGTPAHVFKSHVAIAKKHGYEFVSHLDELRQGKTSRRKLLLCFDDGFHGVYDEREYLLEEGISPLIFLAAGFVGKPGFLTWDEIRELQSLGFHFQAHTWNHRRLAGEWPGENLQRTEEWFRHELYDSKVYLEENLSQPIRGICFPAGMFSRDVIRRCREIGYTELYTSLPGNVDSLNALTDCPKDMLIARCLCYGLSSSDFLCLLQGGLQAFKKHYLAQQFVGP